MDKIDYGYSTKDLGEAAALIAVGHKLMGLDWKDDIAFFSFYKQEDCKSVASKYFLNELTVSARLYYDTLRSLKHKMFNKKGVK